MAYKVQKPCKICGKMFTPCSDCENDKIMFRWKRFACSTECAKKYFAKIEESRKCKSEIKNTQNNNVDNSETTNTVDTEIIKPKMGRKKKMEKEESEQID